MAIDPRTGARVYLEIKRAILSGELRQRQRLDIDTLAEGLSASATPVRHALAILAGERLVTAHARARLSNGLLPRAMRLRSKAQGSQGKELRRLGRL